MKSNAPRPADARAQHDQEKASAIASVTVGTSTARMAVLASALTRSPRVATHMIERYEREGASRRQLEERSSELQISSRIGSSLLSTR